MKVTTTMYVWVRGNSIFARKSESTPVIAIKNLSSLQNLSD